MAKRASCPNLPRSKECLYPTPHVCSYSYCILSIQSTFPIKASVLWSQWEYCSEDIIYIYIYYNNFVSKLRRYNIISCSRIINRYSFQISSTLDENNITLLSVFVTEINNPQLTYILFCRFLFSSHPPAFPNHHILKFCISFPSHLVWPAPLRPSHTTLAVALVQICSK